MVATNETANSAFYPIAMQMPSPSSAAFDDLTRSWDAPAPSPFLVKAYERKAPVLVSSRFTKVRSSVEMAFSVLWVVACAVVSVLWVASFRMQPRNFGTR